MAVNKKFSRKRLSFSHSSTFEVTKWKDSHKEDDVDTSSDEDKRAFLTNSYNYKLLKNEYKKALSTLNKLRDTYDVNKTNKDLNFVINDYFKDIKTKYARLEEELRETKDKFNKSQKILESISKQSDGNINNIISNVTIPIRRTMLYQSSRIDKIASEAWDEHMLMHYLEVNRMTHFIEVFFNNTSKTLEKRLLLSFEKDSFKPNVANLVAAPVENLVALLTLPINSPLRAFWHYNRFLYHFLIIFPVFLKPVQLIELLVEKWEELSGEKNDLDSSTYRYKLSIVNVIREWLTLAGSNKSNDFKDSKVRETLLSLISKNYDSEFRHTMDQLQLQLETLEAKNDAPTEFTPVLPEFSESYITLELINSLELARQMTLIDAELFNNIDRDQWLKDNWYGKNKREKAPDILAFIEHGNNVSNWVITEILKFSSALSRANIISLFIHTTEDLKIMNNFTGVINILSALHSSTICKLKKTWKIISKQDKDLLASLTELMNNTGHYANYHKHLDIIEDKPCIPLISVICSDLFQINETTADRSSINSDWIDWTKMGTLASRISDVVRFGYVNYPYQPVPAIRKLILESERWSDIDLCFEIARLRDELPFDCSLERSYTNTDDIWENEITERDWKVILMCSKSKSLKAGTVIFQNYSTNNCIHRIKSGLIQWKTALGISNLGEGDVFGEISSLSEDYKVTGVYTAVTDVEVDYFDPNVVDEMVPSCHTLLLYQYLAKKLAALLNKLNYKYNRNVDIPEDSNQLTVQDINLAPLNTKSQLQTISIDERIHSLVTRNTNNEVSKATPLYYQSSDTQNEVKTSPKKEKSSSSEKFLIPPGPRRRRSKIKISPKSVEVLDMDLPNDNDNHPLTSHSDSTSPGPDSSSNHSSDDSNNNNEKQANISPIKLKKSTSSQDQDIKPNERKRSKSGTETQEIKVEEKPKSETKKKPRLGAKLISLDERRDLYKGNESPHSSASIGEVASLKDSSSLPPESLFKLISPSKKVSPKSATTRKSQTKKLDLENLIGSSRKRSSTVGSVPSDLPFLRSREHTKRHSVDKTGGRDATFYNLFQIDGEIVAKELNCAIQNNRKIQGKLYITQNLICFASPNFSKYKEVIRIIDIESVLYDTKREALCLSLSNGQVTRIVNLESAESDTKFIKHVWMQKNPEKSNESESDNKVNQNLIVDNNWQKIINCAIPVSYNKGDVIVKEGTKINRLYQIITGKCRVEIEGKGCVAHLVEDNGIIGEMSFVQNTLTKATVIAETNVNLIYIEAFYLNILIQHDPSVGAKLYKQIAQIFSLRCITMHKLIKKENGKNRDDHSYPKHFRGVSLRDLFSLLPRKDKGDKKN